MRAIDQELQEQMRIDEVEIAHRKQIIGLSTSDIERLRACRDMIERRIDRIVDRFYEKQTSIEEIALLIGDADTLRRLKGHMGKYVLDIFTLEDEIEYVNNRLRIGLVHKRIGVEPKLYLSGVKALKDVLIEVIEEHFRGREELAPTLQALDKVMYFDTTLVFDTYIRSLLNEVEAAREKLESYAHGLEEKVLARTRELEELTRHDPLTGLYNRRAFREHLKALLGEAQRRNRPLSLAFFDIDQFKTINDTLGHAEGDNVLRTVGKCMAETKRNHEIAARIGGDEFCVLMIDTPADEAKVYCERLLAVLKERISPAISIGIAQTGPEDYVSGDELMRAADNLMYAVKTSGNGRIQSGLARRADMRST